MTRWHVALPWLILVAMVTAPAAAQTQDQAQARKHFVLAQAHEKNGDYADAATEYVEAYKYFPSPEFFYNAGRAYELGGDAARAVEHYERYIALDPNGRAVAAARTAIAKLKPQIVTQPTAPSGPGASPSETRKPDATEQPADKPGQGTAERKPEPEKEPRPTPSAGSTGAAGTGTTDVAVTAVAPRAEEGLSTLRITGLSLAGVGLVAAVVGVKFALDASSLSDQIEGTEEQWTNEDLAKFEEGERARTMSIAFTGIGVAALVAGGSLYLWGRSGSATEKRPQTSMSPLIWPGSGGFVVTGRF